MTTTISLDQAGASLAALSALATAAFGLLDASKAFSGGISNIGLNHIKRAMTRFEGTLNQALGAGEWWVLIRANWINGMAKTEQKAVARSLVKLGLTPATAAGLAAALGLDTAKLTAVAVKLANGTSLTEQELNLLGRLSAVLDARLDAGFEMAEQQYRNVSRMLAGVLCIALSIAARAIWDVSGESPPPWWVAVAVGVLAVRRFAQAHGAGVFLVLAHDEVLDFRAASHRDDEQAGG